MATFLLDCDPVTSAAGEIQGMVSGLTSLASTVSGYDISGEYAGEFDFAGPKSAISSNIEACSIKFSNTATFMNAVVNQHTQLQNTLKFDEQKPEDTSSTGDPAGANTPAGVNPSGGGGYPAGGGGYPAGGGGSPAGGGGSPSGGGGSQTPGTPPVTTPASTPASTPESTPESTPSTTPEDEITEIDVKDPKVDTVKKEDTELDDSGSEIFDSDLFKYSEDGLAMIDGKYVISVGKNFGKVGEEILITLKDGTVVKCVIGKVTDEESSVINFFANDKYDSNNKSTITYGLSDKISKVQNCGNNNMYTTENVITNTVEAAASYAKDYKDGKYSFIVKAYEDAGLKIAGSAGVLTGTAVEAFTNAGFKYYEGKPVVDNLLPGDVLVTNDDKLVMYAGDGKFIADTGTYSSSGSSSSSKTFTTSELNRDDYKGVVRYPGVTYRGDDEAPSTAPPETTPGTLPVTTPETAPVTTPDTQPSTTQPPQTLPPIFPHGGVRV